MIRSTQNPRIKSAARLRERKHRKLQNRIVIDGCREAERALNSGVEFIEVFYCRSLLRPENEALLEKLERKNVPCLEVSDTVFGKLAYGQRAEGLVVIASPPSLDLAQMPEVDNPIWAVVESVEKPGNLGAILRSADGAGITGLLVTDQVTDVFNPNAIRASLGTIFSVPVCQLTTEEAICWLLERETRIYAASLEGASDYFECDWHGPSAIALGSEANGLTPAWNVDGIHKIKIPMCGIADSLNVSVAASILFYDALRQRRTIPSHRSQQG